MGENKFKCGLCPHAFYIRECGCALMHEMIFDFWVKSQPNIVGFRFKMAQVEVVQISETTYFEPHSIFGVR